MIDDGLQRGWRVCRPEMLAPAPIAVLRGAVLRGSRRSARGHCRRLGVALAVARRKERGAPGVTEILAHLYSHGAI